MLTQDDFDTFSDLHKDAYGFRPRNHVFFSESTTVEMRQHIWDRAVEHLNQKIKLENEMEFNSIEQFESKVESLIKIGAKDRKTAINWLFESVDVDLCEPEFACYHFNLPYNYFSNY